MLSSHLSALVQTVNSRINRFNAPDGSSPRPGGEESPNTVGHRAPRIPGVPLRRRQQVQQRADQPMILQRRKQVMGERVG